MARTFDGIADGFYWTSPPATAPPFNVSLWFYHPGDLDFEALWSMTVNDESTSDDFFLRIMADETIDFRARDNGSNQTASTVNTFTKNAWSHALARTGNTSARVVYLDGGSPGQNFILKTPDALDKMSIGVRADATPSNFFIGRLAEFAMWDANVEPEELISGFSPLLIRPEHLTFYAPLVRDDIDSQVGAASAGTVLGSPGYTRHPDILRPKSPQYPPTAAGDASVEAIPTTASLTLTTFAPDVAAPAVVTPTTTALVLTTFEPTVTTSVVVRPTTLALVLGTFAPTVVGVAPREATPTTLGLVITTFAPTVAAPAEVIPTTLALVTTAFIPGVAAPAEVAPTTIALVITTFEPAVTTPLAVTPTTLALLLATFAPEIDVSRPVARFTLLAEMPARAELGAVHPARGSMLADQPARAELDADHPARGSLLASDDGIDRPQVGARDS